MRFIPLTPLLAGEWDKIAHLSDDAWAFHLYDWLELEEKAWDLVRKSFLIEHEGRYIGIVPLQMNKKSKVLKSDLMGDSGPALINGLEGSFREKILKLIHQHIEEIGMKNGSPRVEIYLSALAETFLKDRWQVNPLLEFHYSDISTHTLLVDLSKSQEMIIAAFSKDARQQMRKAEDFGFTIRRCSDIDKYYEVHCESYQRTGVSPHPKEFFVNIYERICKKGHATLWEAVDKNGESVAFELIASFKQKSFYWTSCCKTRHLDSGVNYLMQIHSMLWAKSQGALWFETGEVFPGVREGKERGLTVFKDKFGGQVHRLFKGRLLLTIPAQKTNAFKAWVRASISLLKSMFGIKG